jgi:alpha-beta hydrolase superfamily lysophospholipase
MERGSNAETSENGHCVRAGGRRRRLLAAAALMTVAAVGAACAPETQRIGEAFTAPALRADMIQTADGALLPLRAWLPAGKPKAVILALHGMNEHAGTFEMPATAWRNAGLAVYAYDQRSFGGAAQPGVWPGADQMADDFATAVSLLRARHPGMPLFAVGSSMGGGVLLIAMARPGAPPVDGVILEAPAVWSRARMPGYQSAALWIAAHTVPDLTLTGRGLNRIPSDNRVMLRARGRDPLIQKSARVDALWGVTDLMDRAYAAAPTVRAPVLLLYGENDQIIPRLPIEDVARRLPSGNRRVAIYRNGWHMLFRDLDSATVHRDVIAWIADRHAPLPSGADRTAAAQLVAEPKTGARR